MNTAFKQILVHMDAAKFSGECLALARQIAQDQGAAVAALYAALPSFVELPYAPEIGPSVAASLMEIDEDRRARARVAFDQAMSEPGPVASWGELLEMPLIGAFAQQALHADLVVMGQRDPSDAGSADVPADFVESVISASGKPALVVPYAGRIGAAFETVVIAWKETREAARAVAAAMPFLQRAGQVHVLTWAAAARPLVQGIGLDLDSYLRVHGVRAQWHDGGEEPAQLGELLLSRTFDLSADLMVMGCYGHGRAREWILGGTTRTVLRSMTVPLLMVH